MARHHSTSVDGGADGGVLGSTTRVQGRIHGTGSLRIEGSVEGEVRISGDIDVAEGGSITGDIDAQSVTVSGSITGDIAAQGIITILAGARVIGNLGGSEISLDEDATFSGRIEADFDLPPELTGQRR